MVINFREVSEKFLGKEIVDLRVIVNIIFRLIIIFCLERKKGFKDKLNLR